MKFTKMHGIGNDFIVVDRINNVYDANFVELARKQCDRNKGIGADGILLIEESEKADAMMRLINADGSEAEMCGNGIRCVGKYVIDKNMATSPVKINTLAGVMTIEKVGNNYKVDMGNGRLESKTTVNVNNKSYDAIKVDMGNPHATIFVDDFDFDWKAEGRVIENDSQFPNRTNVEFVKIISRNELDVKVWERGAGATLACGTGACASLVAAASQNKADLKATIHLRGGDLEIELNDHNVFMTGPATTVFEGECKLLCD